MFDNEMIDFGGADYDRYDFKDYKNKDCSLFISKDKIELLYHGPDLLDSSFAIKTSAILAVTLGLKYDSFVDKDYKFHRIFLVSHSLHKSVDGAYELSITFSKNTDEALIYKIYRKLVSVI